LLSEIATYMYNDLYQRHDLRVGAKTMTKDETDIIAEAQTGNREAFRLVVERYQSLVCAVTYNATGDIDLSEDVAQETFLTAWNKLRDLRDVRKLGAWLCGIARNIAKDTIRREKSKIPLITVDDRTIDDLRAKTAPQSSQCSISKEEQKILWQSLDRIPSIYREPMILFYREQQSVAHVAEELELSEDAVKQRLSRGRKLLKREVATFVEDMLRQTGPRKIFTMAVIAALPAAAPQTASAAIMATAGKSSALTKFAGLMSLIGGILAPLLALIGIIVAMKPEIKNMSQRERRESLRSNLIMIPVLIILNMFLVSFAIWWGMYVRHSQWILITIGCVLIAIFALVTTPFLVRSSHRVKQIQIEEGTYVKPELRALNITTGQIYGAFGGSIIASLLWLIRVSLVTKDSIVLWLVLATGVFLFCLGTMMCLRVRQFGFQIASGVMVAIGLLHLVVVNLRWDKWVAILKYRDITLRLVNFLLVAGVILLVMVALMHVLWLQNRKKQSQQSSD
jgi:RNA polymerase sigma factor (sigma-70 family)